MWMSAIRRRVAWPAVILLALLVCALQSGVAAAQGVSHTVQPGDSLGAIAATYGVTVEAIVRANGLPNADFIWIGQKLTVPVQRSGSQTSDAASGRVYTVKLGDSLLSIASSFGISMAALTEANNISNSDVVWIGQKLLIPGPPDAAALPTTAAGEVSHTVRAGDTLGAIAARYDTSAAAIARANRLTSPDRIYVGMQLIIPPSESALSNYQGQVSRFVVSISQQRCWLYAGNVIIANWRCSTGQGGAATRPGSYAVQSKIERAYGSVWNIWMPYWLGIYWAGPSENGIHGIPYNAATGWRLWEGYVGTPVTYGCVLLDNAHAKILYDLAYIGMPVIIQR